MNDSAASFGLHNTTQVPYTFRAGFFVSLFVLALPSVTGNVLLIIIFLKTLNLRTSTNYYITSMAISDLLSVATNMVLFTKTSHSIFQHSLSSYDYKFKIYSSYVSYSVSIISLVLITVDRFVSNYDNKKDQGGFHPANVGFINGNHLPTVPLFTNSAESNETISLSDGHEHEQGVKDHLLHGGFCATLLCTSCHYFPSQLPNHQILQESKSGD